MAAIDSHPLGTPGIADRYAGLITSGLAIDPRELSGLGPAYGRAPAIASEADAWTRAASRADAGTEVGMRGFGVGFRGRGGVASAGLSASCCDDCGESDNGGCSKGESFRDDSAALSLGGVEKAGLEYFDVTAALAASAAKGHGCSCEGGGGCRGGCDCSKKKMPTPMLPAVSARAAVARAQPMLELPNAASFRSAQALERAAAAGLPAAASSSFGRLAATAPRLPAASVMQTAGLGPAPDAAFARQASATQTSALSGSAISTSLRSATPAVSSIASVPVGASSLAYAGQTASVSMTAPPSGGTVASRFRLPTTTTGQLVPSAGATLFQATSAPANIVATFGKTPTAQPTGPISVGSSAVGMKGPGPSSSYSKDQPGIVDNFGKRTSLDSFLRFAIELAASQPPDVPDGEVFFRVLFGALQKMAEQQIPPPAEYPDPDYFRALIGVARRRRRASADVASIVADYPSVVTEAEREPLHLEPALLDLIVYVSAIARESTLRDVWRQAWQWRRDQAGPLPTPPDLEFFKMLVYLARAGATPKDAQEHAHVALRRSSLTEYPLYCDPSLLNTIVYFAVASPDAKPDDVYAFALHALSQDPTRPWPPRPLPDLNLARRIVSYARWGGGLGGFSPRDLLSLAVAETLELKLQQGDDHIELALLDAIISAAIQYPNEDLEQVWRRAL